MKTEPLWRTLQDLLAYAEIHPAHFAIIFNVIADHVEERGAKNYDRDPGETSDWLRAEASLAARSVAEILEIESSNFEKLVERLNKPGKYDPRIADVLNRKTAWDE